MNNLAYIIFSQFDNFLHYKPKELFGKIVLSVYLLGYFSF